MAGPAAPEAPRGKTVIRNIGLMLSGALENPVLDADTLVAVDGRITAFGKEKDVDTEAADVTIDAHGTALCPGLIDSHVHPVFGDWTPRQNQTNWIDSSMHGGVTTMISAGEVHLPGRPKDPKGVVALGITAQRCFSAFPIGGVKMHAGAPILEKGMVEEDFKELGEAGVKLLGEIGLGGVKAGDEAKQMVDWARKYGIQSTIHTGGPSIPGSGLIDKDVVLEAGADIIGHINGGHTALPLDQIQCLCEQCGADARSRLRRDRGRPRRRFRIPRPRAAHGRQGFAGKRSDGRSARGRHGRDRRQGRVGPQPQHPAGGARAGSRLGAPAPPTGRHKKAG